MKTTKQRGGARPGSGRKPLDGDAESVMYSMRVTPAQRAKIDAIGGAARLRKFIDLAKAPA